MQRLRGLWRADAKLADQVGARLQQYPVQLRW